MAPKLKVQYFPIPHRGEFIRATLAAGGVDFEDHRLTFAEWGPVKESLPLGSLPVLYVDGKVFACELSAVIRYCGKIAGLFPEDKVEALRVDEMESKLSGLFVDFIKSYHAKFLPFNPPHSAEKFAELHKTFEQETFPKWATAIEKYRTMQGLSGCKYLCGDKMTIADIYLWVNRLFMETDMFASAQVFTGYEKFPFLQKLHENMKTNENLKKYYKNLKITDEEKQWYVKFQNDW